MEKVKNFLESTKVKVAAVSSTLLSAPVLFAGDAPVVPTTPQTELPETGETDHTGAAVLGLAMVVSAMSIIGSKKRKEEE